MFTTFKTTQDNRIVNNPIVDAKQNFAEPIEFIKNDVNIDPHSTA